MQRSKINDYFAFPNKIDMRPYTIDHLSNPTEDTPEDTFELVGILVHAGTAESGHYYSYVRERPTESETQTWVEFNDDVVSSWDPSLMASSCFGGPDYPSHLQQNSAVYDKQYSAYMLFYERSSSLAEKQSLVRRGECSIPLAVNVPERLRQFIQDENTWILRRHCLFDPSQVQFVSFLLLHLKSFSQNGCSRDHAMETQALAMALGHLDQVASRTKDIPEFFNLLNRIRFVCQSCAHCNLAVLDYFMEYPEVLKMLVQKNADPDVRQGTVSFIIRILQVLKAKVPAQYGIAPQDEDEGADLEGFDHRASVITGMIRLFEHLWQNFQVNLRSWQEVFDFMLSFVKLGRHELAAFLAHPTFLKSLLLIVAADSSELMLPAQFVKLITVVSRRAPSRAPSYEAIIALLDVLLANVRLGYVEGDDYTGVNSAMERVRLKQDLEPPFEVTISEAEILHAESRANHVNIFIDRLISIGQNHAATNSIIANLMKQSRPMEDAVFRTLQRRITGQVTHLSVAPYLRVAGAVFCRVASDANLINSLISHVSQECLSLQNSEGKAFLDFARETFEGPRERSGQSTHKVTMTALDNVPVWAPGLLGCFDAAVIDETELFLQDKLFRHSTLPPPSDEEPAETRELAEKLRLTGRALGLRCLWYLRDNYVLRGIEVTERAVAGLQRVIHQCSNYFNLEDPSDSEAQEFAQLSHSKS